MRNIAAYMSAWFLNYMRSQSPKGTVPRPLFLALCALLGTSRVELAVVREKEERKEILLLKRGADPHWGDGYYLPGVIGLKRNETLNGALARLIKTEIGFEVTGKKFAGILCFREGEVPRGPEWSNLFVASPTSSDPVLPKGAGWFPLDELPNDLLPTHRKRIDRARHFLETGKVVID